MKEIKLTQGKVVLVDDIDFDWLNQWKWYYDHGYARRDFGGRNNKIHIYMHRLIITGKEIDHINGNGLDNRRSNLRVATHADNLKNMTKHKDTVSGLKGAYFAKDKNRWFSRIMVNGKNFFLGYFSTKEESAKAYDAASKELHGDFGRRNYE